jgi:hypothetical protein
MVKQYNFPLQLFLIFENLEPMVFTHENLTANHYVVIVPQEEVFNLSCVLKNETFFGFNFLTEISAVDTLKYSKFIPELAVEFSKSRILVHYIFYLY